MLAVGRSLVLDGSRAVESGVPWCGKHLTFPSVFVDVPVEFSVKNKTKNIHVK